ncbi:MAG: FG-GAP-like repeat-containing protein, partial [Bacteroidia bacterium]|nr:FG-GAP-like repeat-containing protein [Bacteroidia bacterium]MDW8334299.1 FG-GAP-like repeat-containing protein [Bacteroidia bacterium]
MTAYWIWICLTTHVWSQSLRNDEIVRTADGDTIPFAWTGGMNAPQFSVDDFDDDGRDDLLVYDRQDHTYFFLSAMQKHEPDWNRWLDNVSFTDFVLVRDFDRDGRGDLFTGYYNTIRVWRNEAKSGRPARYRLFANPLKSKYYDSILDLYCAGIDLPGIEDVDGDGDLDLMVYDVGGTKVEYHRNLALEKHNRLDKLDFELASACWGHFYEQYDALSNINTLVLDIPPCPGEFKTTHAGGTL